LIAKKIFGNQAGSAKKKQKNVKIPFQIPQWLFSTNLNVNQREIASRELLCTTFFNQAKNIPSNMLY